MNRNIFEQQHQLFRDSFRRFVTEEIVPHHEQWEENGEVSREVWKKAGEYGFLCMAVPEEYGGVGTDDFRFNMIISEELARVGATGPGFPLQTDIVLPYLLRLATDEQKRRWFPAMVQGESIWAIAMTEPNTGSDLSAVQTTAKPNGDGYVVNGSKTFITNGIMNDAVIVVARSAPKDQSSHEGLSLLVVERGMSGYDRGRRLKKMGMHAQDTAELFFNDVHVPRKNLLGQEGHGFYYLMENLAQERLILAVGAVALAEAAFEWTSRYCMERTAFGRPIGKFQNSRFKLAEMKTEIEIARVFVDRCVSEHNAGSLSPVEACMAKLWTTEMQKRVVDQCLQLHGGYGYMLEYPIAKAYIDSRAATIFAGTNEIMKEVIGRSLGFWRALPSAHQTHLDYQSMADQLRFDGRVVIVTGAGHGLGRSHALMFAARGAKVVVNDLGGGAHGGGHSTGPADAVVAEIKAFGGEAIANHDSVEDGERIVQTAVNAFGTIDVVVNNAGILRDASFQKMTAEDWDLIYRVHLKGAFRVTHAAWPILRAKQYGRVIMTSSGAGIYGNFGQANYSAMKLGLLGLSNTLAVEGMSKNILVNTIAPVAASRLTESVLPKELFDSLKPELISPLVLWLCHESSTESGGLFELGAGRITKLRWERTVGHPFRQNAELRPEQIAASWPKVCDFEHATHPSEVTASMGALLEHMTNPSRGGNEFIDLDAAASQPALEYEAAYNERDLALYALGVGVGANPLDPTELTFLNEGSGEFQALPTYAAIPAANAMLQLAKEGASLPGLNVGFDRILHGEQYVELRRPLPVSAKLKHKIKLRDAYDKGEHAIAVVEVRSFDELGQEIAYNEMTSFLRDCGGWGGERGPSGEVNQPPMREPDAVVEEKTGESQALLYRLSGDWNPLHVDPAFAKAFGFDRPILHGLCTFGYAGRHVLKAFGGGDPRRFRSIKVRFTGVVFPGETLVTRMWKESDKRVVFETAVKERDKLVIKNAAVELGEPVAAPTAAAATPASSADSRAASVISADVFSAISSYVSQTPELVSRAMVVLEFRLSQPDSVWSLDLKNAPGSATPAPAIRPDATLACSEDDFVSMCLGTTDAMKLFMSGKLKISGNMGAAQKLEFFKKLDRSLVQKAMQARLGLKKGESSPAPSRESNAQAPAIFRELAARFAKDRGTPTVAAGQVVVFKVQEPEATWHVDFQSASPSVNEGDHADPSAVIQLSDEDLLALAAGTADPQDLFQRGRLRVDGNVLLAHALGFLVGAVTAQATSRREMQT